jgi:hypothetical protein
MAKHAKQPEKLPQVKKTRRSGRGCLIAALVALLVLMLAAAAVALYLIQPSFAQPAIQHVMSAVGIVSEEEPATEEPPRSVAVPSDASSALAVSDKAVTAEVRERQAAESESEAEAPTKLVAQCEGVDIYSPIAHDDLTGILFHQASYEWAKAMTTELPEADLEKIYDHEAYLEVFEEDDDSDWMEANCVHIWRETDSTPMDTSIDMGAPAGSTVYAPVTGDVVLVLDYDLYDEVPDVQIHIRPDDNPDLDIVLLHQTDPQVQAGDHVEGGVTPISSVRDIAGDLTDVQLGFYTEGDDPGNHSHVQVNDLHNTDYLKKYFKGIELDGIDTNFPEEEEEGKDES